MLSEESESIFERDAELCYQKHDEIEIAAQWCLEKHPHSMKFLDEVYVLLVKERESLAKFRLESALRTGAVKRRPLLAILSPSQALRLLKCHKRAMLNSPEAWKIKHREGKPAITELERLERAKKLRELRAKK